MTNLAFATDLARGQSTNQNKSVNAQQQQTVQPSITVNVMQPSKTDDEKRQEKEESERKKVVDDSLVKFTGQLANYTLWLFIATLLLATGTAVLIFVGELQRRQLKRTVDSSEKSEGPFLIPELLLVEDDTFNDGTRPKATYFFRNDGKTPAIIRRFQDRMRLIERLPDSEQEIYGNEVIDDRPGQYIAVGQGQPAFKQGTVGGVIECRLDPGDLPNLTKETLINSPTLTRIEQ